MKAYIYLKNSSPGASMQYLDDIEFAELPMIGDIILINNESYKVYNREFNTYIANVLFSKHKQLKCDDVNLYVEQITNNYKPGTHSNNGK